MLRDLGFLRSQETGTHRVMQSSIEISENLRSLQNQRTEDAKAKQAAMSAMSRPSPEGQEGQDIRGTLSHGEGLSSVTPPDIPSLHPGHSNGNLYTHVSGVEPGNGPYKIWP